MKYLNNWMLFETMNPNDIKKFNRKEKLKVYHRTKDANISLIGRDGFRSGIGNAWGDGIYTCYDLISTTKDNRYNSGSSRESAYGPVIIENEVLSLKDFLIFDYDAAKQYYGKDYSIKSQIEKIVPEEIYQKFLPSIEQAHLICLERRDNKRLHSTDAVRQIYEIDEIMDHVRGIVFTGPNDGKVLLSYDRENIVPIRYSNDNGKTWNKIKDKGAYRKAKENFMDLIKSETKTDLIIDKIKDRIANFITTRFGATKNIDNINYKEIKIVEAEFDYIFKNNLTFQRKHNFRFFDDVQNTEEYKLYQKSLDTITKEFEGYFKSAFNKFIEWTNKVDLSKSSELSSINEEFRLLYHSRDKSDEQNEILSKIKVKLLDNYEKKVLSELSEITKDDDFFSKFIELGKKYKHVPDPDKNESDLIFIGWYTDWGGDYSPFGKDYGAIAYVKSFRDQELVEKIISDISNNLIKKINFYLNNLKDKIRFINTQFGYNYGSPKEIDDIFMKEDVYNSTFKNLMFLKYLLDITGSRLIYRDPSEECILVIQKAIESDNENIDNFKKSILDSYDYFCKYISETCKEINGIFDKIDKKSEDLSEDLSDFIIARFDGDEKKVKSQIIYTLLAMKDNTVLNKLASDGFLSDKSLVSLKLSFGELINSIGNIKILDFQKSRILSEAEKQFNNPDYTNSLRFQLTNEENYILYKKLKSEGKNVSNWSIWIKILILKYLRFPFSNDQGLEKDLGIDYIINNDKSREEILNDLITLDINLFTDKTIEKVKKYQNDYDLYYSIVKDISYKLFRKELDIELYLSYLSKIKDTTNEKYYTIATSKMIIEFINDENHEKLKPLAQYLINNSLKKEFIDEGVIDEDIVRVTFPYDLITLSDIIGKPVSNDLIGKCANYKLRKILKENNLEKIKSYLKFLKENKINIYLCSGDSLGRLKYDEIKLNELDFEIIDTMLMNDQISVHDLSKVADDDLVIKTLKYIDKPNYDYMLKVIKDPNLKQKVEMELFSKTNNFDTNIDIFLKNYKKLDINKLIEDLNRTYAKSDEPVDFFDLLNIILITDKKEELLNKIDKNIFTIFSKYVIKEVSKDKAVDVFKFSELREEYVKKFPTIEEFFTLENFKITLESIYKYLSEEAKNILMKIIKLDDKVSEKIILKFETFSKNF